MTNEMLIAKIVGLLETAEAEKSHDEESWFLELDEEQCDKLWKYHLKTGKCSFKFWREFDAETGEPCEGHWDDYTYNEQQPYEHGEDTRFWFIPNAIRTSKDCAVFELYDCTAGNSDIDEEDMTMQQYIDTLIFYSNNLEDIYDLLSNIL